MEAPTDAKERTRDHHGRWTTGEKSNDNDTVEIKSEHSDDVSIHHDDVPEQPSDSMIQVDSTTPHTETQPLVGIPIKPHLRPLSISQAPAEVLDMLEQWYAVHGREMPRWAGHAGATGKKGHIETMVWLHSSKEILKGTLYEFDNVPDPRKTISVAKRVWIVEGHTLGAKIAIYHKSGGCLSRPSTGTRYKIWLGVDGGTPDSLERHASVWKGNCAGVTINSTTLPFVCAKVFNAEAPIQSSPSQSLVQSQIRAQLTLGNGQNPESVLPKRIQIMLQAWYEKKGRAIPPCAGSFTKRTLTAGANGSPTGFWHVSGERVLPEIVALSTPGHRTVLLFRPASRESGLHPVVAKLNKQCGADVYAYTAWHGLRGATSQGF